MVVTIRMILSNLARNIYILIKTGVIFFNYKSKV